MAKDEAEKDVAPEQEMRAIENTETDDVPTEDTPVTESEEVTNETPEAPVDPSPADKTPWWKHAWQWAVTHKKLSIPSAVGIVLLLLAVIPATRYALAGTVISKEYTVVVVDAQTKQPVSSADVTLAGTKGVTDGRGQAKLHVPVGNAELKVAKKYYKSASQSVLVPLGKQEKSHQVALVATGRQVPMVVVNSITKKPVAGAVLQALDTKAKTDKQGKATLVVPAGKESLNVTVEATGYNKQISVVIFEAGVAKTTTAAMVPAGKVYFLSNKSGKIDVVKANLDGSDRAVVVAGTGKEDRYNTSLLASRDWRYLVLHARRDSENSKLYLIDTATDKISVMDEGDANFELSGWSDHSFIYKVTRHQPINKEKYQALKSFNATNGRITTLDETKAQNDGTGNTTVYELLGNVFILDNEVVYTKNWSSSWNGYYNVLLMSELLGNKQATLNSVQPDGKGKKVVKGYGRFEQENFMNLNARSYTPQEVYILYSNNPKATVDEYKDGQVKSANNVSREDFYERTYPTYLISPSGERAFWTDNRDGKNAFFVGDKQGENEKQLGAIREYGAYGWYDSDYLLVSKNGSELYVLAADTFKSEGDLTKITDYYRSQVYSGYGYGYGGL